MIFSRGYNVLLHEGLILNIDHHRSETRVGGGGGGKECYLFSAKISQNKFT